MKKGAKLFYFSIILIAAIFSVSAIVSNKASIGWESASDIKIRVGTSDKSLAETNSLAGDSLLSSSLEVSSGTAPVSGHNADEIWVSVSGQEMTLKQARATPGLCGLNNPKTTYSSKPSTLQYHYGTQIEMPSGKNLQEEINLGNVLYTNNYSKICTSRNIYSYQDSCNRQGNLIEDCNVVQECGGGTYGCHDDSSGIYRDTSEQTCYQGSCDVTNGCSESPVTSPATTVSLSTSYHRYWYGTKSNTGGIRWAITDRSCGHPDPTDSSFKSCVKNYDIYGSGEDMVAYCGDPVNNGAYYPTCANIGGVYCKRFSYGEDLEWCGSGGKDGTWADYSCNSNYDSSCNYACPAPRSDVTGGGRWIGPVTIPGLVPA